VSHPDTCVVIPVYNEDKVITAVVDDVLAVFDHVVAVVDAHDMVEDRQHIVDDGSTDNTLEALEKTDARIVRHPVNLGQGAALQTGIDYALADPTVRSIVTYDADGQHQVSDAARMVDILEAGDVDIVFGSRFLDDRTEVGWSKRAVLKLAVRYTNATTGLRLSDAHNGLRAFDRNVAERLEIRMNGMAHASEFVSTVADGKFRYAETPVHIIYSDYSKAKGQSLLNSVNILFDLLFR
jgi:glycosyltransferase involved in cell wall biosynthesis